MTTTQKQCLLKYFGCYEDRIDGIWGSRSREGTKALQRALMLTDDGTFGAETEKQVRALIAGGADRLPAADRETGTESWWKEICHFAPEEFACKCGRGEGYCQGWPHDLQELVVRICDRVRIHFEKPVIVVSGLRCRRHNQDSGGLENSQHMYGEAADIYVADVSAQRVLAYLQSQPDVRYAYRISGSENVHFDIEKQNR